MHGDVGAPPREADVEVWQPARLIPVSGIRGQEEQEKRATSSLLAVMAAVPDFGKAVLRRIGAPAGRVTTFAEVQLKASDGKLSIPDGAIVIERGARGWRALVEVKTSSSRLGREQVSRYLDMARLHGFDAVLTISNELTPSPEESPVTVDRRKTRSVALRHLSWWQILTEAIVQHRHHGIEDPDQAWILAELIAYLDHENSGASGFQDMGDKWVKVRNAARDGTLRASDSEVHEIASRWDQLVSYLCLGLSQDLGREVKPTRPRKQTTDQRRDQAVKQLAEEGTLTATLRVPDAAGDLVLEADLRSRDLRTSVDLDAPQEGRPKTRITWLLRQLRSASDDVRVDVAFPNLRETTSALLGVARQHPDRLLLPSDSKRPPRRFTITLSRPMGTKRGRGEASFVRETRRQAIDFYRDLVQGLTAWRPKAPRYPDEPDESPTPIPEPDGLLQPPAAVGYPHHPPGSTD
jgi:hypothetical protein